MIAQRIVEEKMIAEDKITAEDKIGTEVVLACNICRSGHIQTLDPEFNFCRCESCGYVFDSPRPSFPEISAFYSQAGKYDVWLKEERARDMLWLYATNVLAILFTVGLAVPWSRIRLARYRADSLTLEPGGPLETAALAGGLDAAATGAELSDAMDLDFGL